MEFQCDREKELRPFAQVLITFVQDELRAIGEGYGALITTAAAGLRQAAAHDAEAQKALIALQAEDQMFQRQGQAIALLEVLKTYGGEEDANAAIPARLVALLTEALTLDEVRHRALAVITGDAPSAPAPRQDAGEVDLF